MIEPIANKRRRELGGKALVLEAGLKSNPVPQVRNSSGSVCWKYKCPTIF